MILVGLLLIPLLVAAVSFFVFIRECPPEEGVN